MKTDSSHNKDELSILFLFVPVLIICFIISIISGYCSAQKPACQEEITLYNYYNPIFRAGCVLGRPYKTPIERGK